VDSCIHGKNKVFYGGGGGGGEFSYIHPLVIIGLIWICQLMQETYEKREAKFFPSLRSKFDGRY
jgi:hypothetical protein